MHALSPKATARVFALGLASLVVGCGNGNGAVAGGAHSGGAGGSPGSVAPGDGGSLFAGGLSTGTSSASGASTGSGASGAPKNFVAADIGAYALGAPITGTGPIDTGLDSASGCATLVGIARDFRGMLETDGHPDFEAFSGAAQTPGLVEAALGSDGKPVYAGQCDGPGTSAACPFGQQLTSKARFDQWYRHNDGVDLPYLVYLQFVANAATGVSTFESSLFFPLDGVGFGLSGAGTDGKQHDFGFTTEIHTKFKYSGGEQFTFTGDDDLWVFINQKLAIDLGGLHSPATMTVSLDQLAGELGLAVGGVYPLDLFNAERHTEGSNFRVDTNLGFVDCGTIPAQPR